MTPCPGAIVAGASYRALAVVRSLGRRGVPVWVLQTDEHSVARYSRFVRGTGRWSRGDDLERYGELIRIVEHDRLAGWALIATDDEDAATIARLHPVLSETLVLTVPPWNVLEAAYDKRVMHALAARAEVAQPATVFPGGVDQLSLVQRFPVVVKPAHKAVPNELTRAKCWRADDPASLAALYERACGLMDAGAVMVQEHVSGDGQFSFGALCQEGRVLASLTARRTRQYPLDFGKASTFVETIEDQTVENDARRLLAAMRLSGLVEVEFKRDPRTGANLLLDVNPRAWGWQSIGATAGVDFPYLLWQLACALPVRPTDARPGVGWMRMVFDVPAATAALRAGLTVREYLRSFRRPLAHAVLAADDPLPGLLDTVLLGSIFASRLRRGHAG
jgi:predicted ATP-grasp superfamily ATP-dependent carboligase